LTAALLGSLPAAEVTAFLPLLAGRDDWPALLEEPRSSRGLWQLLELLGAHWSALAEQLAVREEWTAWLSALCRAVLGDLEQLGGHETGNFVLQQLLVSLPAAATWPLRRRIVSLFPALLGQQHGRFLLSRLHQADPAGLPFLSALLQLLADGLNSREVFLTALESPPSRALLFGLVAEAVPEQFGRLEQLLRPLVPALRENRRSAAFLLAVDRAQRLLVTSPHYWAGLSQVELLTEPAAVPLSRWLAEPGRLDDADLSASLAAVVGSLSPLVAASLRGLLDRLAALPSRAVEAVLLRLAAAVHSQLAVLLPDPRGRGFLEFLAQRLPATLPALFSRCLAERPREAGDLLHGLLLSALPLPRPAEEALLEAADRLLRPPLAEALEDGQLVALVRAVSLRPAGFLRAGEWLRDCGLFPRPLLSQPHGLAALHDLVAAAPLDETRQPEELLLADDGLVRDLGLEWLAEGAAFLSLLRGRRRERLRRVAAEKDAASPLLPLLGRLAVSCQQPGQRGLCDGLKTASAELVGLLFEELRPQLPALMAHREANYFVQAVLGRLPPHSLAEAVSAVEAELAELAADVSGSFSLQRLTACLECSGRLRLLSAALRKATAFLSLAENVSGRHFLCHLLIALSPDPDALAHPLYGQAAADLANTLRPHLVGLADHPQAAQVLRAALGLLPTALRDELLAELLAAVPHGLLASPTALETVHGLLSAHRAAVVRLFWRGLGGSPAAAEVFLRALAACEDGPALLRRLLWHSPPADLRWLADGLAGRGLSLDGPIGRELRELLPAARSPARRGQLADRLRDEAECRALLAQLPASPDLASALLAVLPQLLAAERFPAPPSLPALLAALAEHPALSTASFRPLLSGRLRSLAAHPLAAPLLSALAPRAAREGETAFLEQLLAQLAGAPARLQETACHPEAAAVLLSLLRWLGPGAHRDGLLSALDQCEAVRSSSTGRWLLAQAAVIPSADPAPTLAHTS
jgi:hypothetical protein